MKNENINVNDLIKMLSTMDKDELANGLSQASKILNSPKADDLINEINKKQKNNQ